MAYWIKHSSDTSMPRDVLEAGHDFNGSTIYVGRACFNGDRLLAKVAPNNHCGYVAYVAWGGKEHKVPKYELLVGYYYNWVQCDHGHLPPNAVTSGITRQGEPLYIGRIHYSGSLCIGNIHTSHECIYVPFGGQEIKLKQKCEVLINHLGELDHSDDECLLYKE